MVADVADALHHAHQNGVIHRDVKPSNLLLSPDGRLSVNDFGLARVLEQPGMTVTGEFVGTPAYMSPEQITAGRIPIDHRTDVYSLGTTLYELLTLRPPFVGDRRDLILAQVVQKEPTPPRRVNLQVPRDLETVCLKCLEKDPDRRYQKAKDLADDLRRFVNRFAILARRPGPLTRAKKWVRRNPWVSGLAAAVLVAAGVAGFFAWRAYDAGQRLQAERREQARKAALEKAYLAAMSGDQKAADRAIAEADQIGASPGEVLMLRGLVSLYCQGGRADVAIENFKQATELMPDSVAAHALLAFAYSVAGQMVEWSSAFGRASELTPVTPEDFMFLARLEVVFDSERGVRRLERAGPPMQSALARVVRAEILNNRALETGDAEDVRRAVVASEAAVEDLPDNPVALANRVHARLAAAAAHEDDDTAPERAAALKQAREYVDDLARRFPDVPVAITARFSYYAFVDDDANMLAEVQRLRNTLRRETDDAFAANLLYRAGKLDEALGYATRSPQPQAPTLVNRAFILRELGRVQETRAAYDQAVAGPELIGPLYVYSQLILRFLGDVPAAQRECKAFQQRQVPEQQHWFRNNWYRKVLAYNAGDIREEDLLREAGRSRWSRCEAHFFIAMTKLGEGDRDGAFKHFEKCVRTRMYQYFDFDYGWSQTFLARMSQDPNWPRWIPHLAPPPRPKP